MFHITFPTVDLSYFYHKNILSFSGGDSHILRKQEEVIQESAMMITDCQKRLSAAYADLKAVLENEKDLSETEEFQNASKALELALPHF